MGRVERRQQKKSSERKQKSLRSKSVTFKIIVSAAVAALLMVVGFYIAVLASDVSKLEYPAPQPTIIYDKNGKEASSIASTKIEGVDFADIPKHMLHAVIATEDQRFYKHNGVNYAGIARALFQNVKSGEIVAGGSTITQQLAKNAFLTQDRTYIRKMKELVLTKKIEATYSKDEIIVRYLNHIYFGEGAWGIQRAAHTYFGKDAKDLTLGEAAMLAGIIKAPSALSPVKSLEKATERRDLVLSLMKQEGYITEEQVTQAKAQKIVLKDKKTDDYNGKYAHYIDHIIEEATSLYGLTPNEILAGGLHIYTELNPTVQEATETVYANNSSFPKSKADQLMQSSAIFIDPATGGIQALVGGRGEHTFRQFNRATQLKRQPGSSMKPLAVYAPALEEGYDVFSKLEDRALNINGYTPQNYDKRYRGEVSMYDALRQSYNVPAVWLMQKIGIETGVKSVERFGIPLTAEDNSPTLALGGMHEGTSPLKMAQAFAAFANDGVMQEAHAIIQIKNADGEVIGKWKKKSTKVMDAEKAQKMTYMLRGVVESGTGQKARVSGREIAGKTGTTQLPIAGINGAKDHWFVGYTPGLVGAIWLGYDQTDASHYLASSSGSTVTTIFKQIVSKSQAVLPEKSFDLSLLGGKFKKNVVTEEEQPAEQEEEKQEEVEEQQETEKEEKKEEKEQEKEEKEAQKEAEKQQKEAEKQQKQEEKKTETPQTEQAPQQPTEANPGTGNTPQPETNTGNEQGDGDDGDDDDDGNDDG